jgi:hypothetical protein
MTLGIAGLSSIPFGCPRSFGKIEVIELGSTIMSAIDAVDIKCVWLTVVSSIVDEADTNCVVNERGVVVFHVGLFARSWILMQFVLLIPKAFITRGA